MAMADSCNYYPGSEFLESLGPPKEKINKIDFIHYYKIIYIKKPAGLSTLTVC